MPITVRSLPIGAASFAALFVLAGCAVVPPMDPAPPPPAPAPPPPAALLVASPLAWEEAPVTPGDWSYSQAGADSVARFGASGSAPLLTLRCTAATRQITLQRLGAGSASTVTIRTTYGALQWPSAASTIGISVVRAASDPGFDWIAFSRGRVSIEANGMPRMIVPVWAEISRIVENCRS
jgi:hypothetical protein